MNLQETNEIPSSEENAPAPSSCAFWPGLLLSIAFNLFLIYQVYAIWNTSSDFNRQERVMLEQLEKLRTDVVPARNIQVVLEGMANDLLTLAQTDPEARRVVDKFQIRRNSATSGQ